VRKKLIFAVGTAAVVLGIVAVAQAAIVQKFTATVSPAKAGKPIGLKVNQSTSLSADEPGYKAAGQPPPQQTQLIRLNKGGAFGGKYFPRCKLAKLQSQGPAGCPSKSKIGTGSGVGSARPVVTDPVNGKLTLFNGERKGGKDTIYVFVLPDLGPTFVVVGTITKKNQGKYGWELRFNIPPIKTINRAPDAAIISVKTSTPVKKIRKSGKNRYLITAPSKCTGKWYGQGEFRFEDGRVVKVSSSHKCKKR
jgi:hypothetical protein